MKIKAIITLAISAMLSLSAVAQEKQTITVNGVSFNMIKVEGGTFKMGAQSPTPMARIMTAKHIVGDNRFTMSH